MSEMLQYLKNFPRESYSELRQATWLTREQAMGSTRVVVVIVGIMSLYVAGVDWVLSILVRAVLGQ